MKKNLLSNESTSLQVGNVINSLFRNKWLVLFAIFIFVAGCKKVDELAGLTGLCPIVVSTTPAKNDTAVSVFPKVTATFNKAMDASTINTTSFTVKQGSTVVPGVVTYAGLTATFTPIDPLAYNKVYTATMAKGVKDPANNAMIADYVWSFTTGSLSDIVIPIVISTDPADGATGVSLNKKISATFSEAMNPSTLNTSTFLIYQG